MIKRSCVKNVLVHAVESLLDAGTGRSQIHAQVAGAKEHGAILDGSAHIPAGVLHILNGLAVGLAPVGAVHEQHIGTLRLGDGHALEMLLDVIAGKVDVAGQHLAELVGPLVALGLVGTDQGVHGENVHHVVVAQAGLLLHAVTPPAVVNDMVAAHQTGQVEGLGGSIDSDSAHPCILADGLGGNVLVAFQNDVRPDLIRNHDTIIRLVDFHGLLDLPAFPDTAAGIVRAAEHGNVDVVCLDLGIHVLVVHPPDTVFILDQRAVNDLIAVVLNAHGEADIGGAVQQHGIAGGSKAVKAEITPPSTPFSYPMHSLVRPVTPLRVWCQRMMES